MWWTDVDIVTNPRLGCSLLEKPILPKRQVLVGKGKVALFKRLAIWGEGELMCNNPFPRFCSAITVFKGKKEKKISVNHQGRRWDSVSFLTVCRLVDSSWFFFRHYWSQVALAFSGLKQGLLSQTEIEAILWQWEHRILATVPVVSDKSPGLWFYRRESPQNENSTIHVDRHTGRLRRKIPESCPCGAWITFMQHFFCVSFG